VQQGLQIHRWKNIAVSFLPLELATQGTQVKVDIGERLRA
jgi:hypothetical protein